MIIGPVAMQSSRKSTPTMTQRSTSLPSRAAEVRGTPGDNVHPTSIVPGLVAPLRGALRSRSMTRLAPPWCRRSRWLSGSGQSASTSNWRLMDLMDDHDHVTESQLA